MDKFNLKVPFLLAFVVLSVVSETACEEVFTFTTTVSVRPGTNRLSCFPLEMANERRIKPFHASWQKRPGANHKWSWLVGVSDPNKHAEIGRPNGTDARYILYGANATLEIRNISKDDNDAEYMCTVRGERGFRESLIYRLSFFEPDESTSQNCTCPETSNNCTRLKGNGTEASGAAKETTDKSATDGKCTAWIIGCVLLLLVCFRRYIIDLLRVVWDKISPYCCTYQRNAICNPPIANELRNENSTSNGNVNNDQDCSNNHDSNGLDLLPYGLHESNGNNENYIIESVD